VVGSKYIRLYAPDQTPKLYANTHTLTSNTSQVDCENPDLTRFPLFSSAEYWECVLGEGATLYIPPGWWHYVRSLSVSFSVSFWFQ
jgi:lysine-specific demethylase 8